MGIVGELNEISGEITVEWIIKEFFSLPSESDRVYNGPVFSFAGASWHLNIYPNGRTIPFAATCSEGYIGLFLRRTSSGPPIELECSLGFKTLEEKVNSERHFTYNFEEMQGYGFHKFINRSQLLEEKTELVPSGGLTVACKMRHPKTADISTSEKLSDDLKTIMLDGVHSDMVVKVKDEEFHLHKSILAGRNTYFNSMFKTDMKEKSSGIVNVEDCEPDTFRSFVHFIYTGKVDTFSIKNVCGLFETADKYQEDQLKNECLRFMMNTLSIDTFCEYFALALRHDEKELFQKGIELFTTESKEIARTAKWQNFVQEYPIQANELFIKTLDRHIK